MYLRYFPYYLLIALAGAVLFLPFLGNVHLFDWDEINFAESSREMIMSGDYFRVQINYQPFWEKPPLFFWLQALSMQLFGVNEYAARFPNAVIGILTLLVIFKIGTKEFDLKFGLFWVMFYAGSFLPHFYFKSGIIDPLFNLCIFLSIYFLSLVASADSQYAQKRSFFALISGAFIGLGILTKGPVALLILLLTAIVFMVIRKRFGVFRFSEILVFSVSAGLVAFLWFGLEIIKNGFWFIEEFIEYQIRLFKTQDAGHGGPFYYHFVILLLGCFPASLFVYKSFSKVYTDSYRQKDFKLWMSIALWVVLILFSIVKTKIVHYSSFCYFPITFLAAYALYKIDTRKLRLKKYFKISFGIIGITVSLALILLPLFYKYKDQLPLDTLFPDRFARANMEAIVYWSGFESLAGVFYLISVIVGLVFISKSKVTKAAVLICCSTMVEIELAMALIVPKVEKYSQAAAIEFFESLQSQDVYVEVVNYKSYAHYFYTQRKPGYNNGKPVDLNVLLAGPLDKPAYFITKVGREADLEKTPGVEKIGEKNGFLFYRRLPH
jgi:4-amino-4-deoxy-L-arabinose transferase-like glycosyltransferase